MADDFNQFKSVTQSDGFRTI